MANSVFLGPFGIVFNGSGFVFSSPGLFPDGTAALPGIAFANEPSSGIQRVGAADVSLQVLGVSRFEANATATSLKAPDGGAYAIFAVGSWQVNSASLNMASSGSNKWSWVAATATDGQIVATTGAGTAGVGLDIATDAVLKVRTRAQTGYATVDCLGLKASGVAGASGTGTVISAITVVNGIITAITVA